MKMSALFFTKTQTLTSVFSYKSESGLQSCHKRWGNSIEACSRSQASIPGFCDHLFKMEKVMSGEAGLHFLFNGQFLSTEEVQD